jgi:hypothetical protein
MATGVVAALGNNASITYTPGSNAKIAVAWAGTSTNVVVGGVAAATGSTAEAAGLVTIYAAGLIPITISVGASMTAYVSALEENS